MGWFGGSMNRFWVDLGVPGGSLGHLGARLAPPSTQGWFRGRRGTHPGRQKPSKIIRKTRLLTKSNKISFFVSNMWTSWKLGCGARKTAFFNIFVTQQMRPKQFWKHPKSSSRIGESSIFNIFKGSNKKCKFATAVFWGCPMRKRCFLWPDSFPLPPLEEF